MFLKIHRVIPQQFVGVFGLLLGCGLHEPVDVLTADLAELLPHGDRLPVRVVHPALISRDLGGTTFLTVGEFGEIGPISLGGSPTFTDVLDPGSLPFDPRSDELTAFGFTKSNQGFFSGSKSFRTGYAFASLTSSTFSKISKGRGRHCATDTTVFNGSDTVHIIGCQ